MDLQLETSWKVAFYHELGHFVADTIHMRKINHIKFTAGRRDFIPALVQVEKFKEEFSLKNISKLINCYAHGCLFQACYLKNEFSYCFEAPNSLDYKANGTSDWLNFNELIRKRFKDKCQIPRCKIEFLLKEKSRSFTEDGTLNGFLELDFKNYLPRVTENSAGDFFIDNEMLKKLSADCDKLIKDYRPKFHEIEDGILRILGEEWDKINLAFGGALKTP